MFGRQTARGDRHGVVDLIVLAADVHVASPSEPGAAKGRRGTGIPDDGEDPIMVSFDLAEGLISYADDPLAAGDQLVHQCPGERRVAADNGVATGQTCS